MFDIFKLVGHRVELTSEILTIKPFRDIFERDSTSDKRRAFSEMLYVYHSVSYRSIGVQKGYDGAILHNYAVENSGVDETFTVDATIKEAMRFYKEHQYTPIDDELIILNKIAVIRNNALEALSIKLKLLSQNVKTDEKDFEAFFNLSDKVSTFTAKIEKDFEIIQKLQDKLNKNDNQRRTIYGKHSYHQSFDSDKDIEKYEHE